ncbi:MAG TPA: protein translocase subunit SecD [Ruminococcaceae bacterium]|nr:protein translocase subunit SecD [Oscillospiraceae bacterium]HCA30968.1 protein translocase subunit SecD [Oscillospiraceae bacterium]
MKRTKKPVFFIVALLILALSYTAIFGVYSYYGDRRDTFIRGASDIRFGIDIRGGVDVTFGPEGDVKNVTEENLNGIKDVIAQRLVGNNITDYEIYSDKLNNQVIVRFPWKNDEEDFDPDSAIEELGKTAQLAFHIGSETEEAVDAEGNKYQKPTGKLVLSGNQVDKAEALYQQNENGMSEPIVKLTLKPEGRKAFADATLQQMNKGTISIWLDQTKISDPSVQAHIQDGIAIISGGFKDFAEASSIANLINSGALPFGIEVKSNGVIDPTLGEKSLDIMVLAGIIAFVIVSLFMVLYYRLPGFVAVISLIGQVAGSLAAISGYFSFIPSFTLTLPGMAGIILSIGMGVDANVITNERIKEEIHAGRTIDGAIARGSSDSFWAIFDGNITVLIVAAVLMGVFGPPSGIWATILNPILRWFPASTTGSIYSFGYTLFVGIIFNFIMGVTASRLMLRSVVRFKFLRKPWLLGGERA